MDERKSFGSWVKSVREAKGMTIAECAKRAGMNPTQWSRMEADEPKRKDGSAPVPRLETIEKVTAGLQVASNQTMAAAHGLDLTLRGEGSYHDDLVRLVGEEFVRGTRWPFGPWLKERRINAGLLQDEAARKLGVPVADWLKLEASVTWPPHEQLSKLARVLDIPLWRALEAMNKPLAELAVETRADDEPVINYYEPVPISGELVSGVLQLEPTELERVMRGISLLPPDDLKTLWQMLNNLGLADHLENQFSMRNDSIGDDSVLMADNDHREDIEARRAELNRMRERTRELADQIKEWLRRNTDALTPLVDERKAR